MLFHIGQSREDAVTLSFGTFGNRFTLDFYEDHVRCDRYGGAEDLRADIGALRAMIDSGEPAHSPTPATVLNRDEEDRAQAATWGLQRLLDFTSHLRAKGIHHAIEQHSSEALEVNFMIEGRRFEVEFSTDDVFYCVFDVQAGGLLDEAAIRREVEIYTRPYPPVMRLRNEWKCAAE